MSTSNRLRPFTAYFHRSKDNNSEAWHEIGGDRPSPAYTEFLYMGYEIGIQTEVDIETGEAYAVGIVDRNEVVELERKVRI